MVRRDTSFSSFWLFEKNKIDKLTNISKDSFASNSVSLTGGDNWSEFNPTLAKKIIGFWSNEGETILDPFAGRTRAIVSRILKRKYIGFEILSNVCNQINESINKQSTLFDLPIPRMINDDCFNIDNYDFKEKFDLIFTCPPYWNLEKYNGGEGDLSNIDNYDEFFERYEKIWRKVLKYLKKDGYLVIVVGDWRKDKKYITFHVDNIKMFEKFEKLKLHDINIVQSVTFDVASRRFGMFKKHKFTAKSHEYILVYKKIQ